MINVLTEQIEGLYDPTTREFYIADWSPLADQRMVMAHELTHALEDQLFQIEAWLKAARPNEDAELARDAVLEGSAMAAMVDYLMLGNRTLPGGCAGLRSGDVDRRFGQHSTLQKAPPFLKDALIFPYLADSPFGCSHEKYWLGRPPGLVREAAVSTSRSSIRRSTGPARRPRVSLFRRSRSCLATTAQSSTKTLWVNSAGRKS